MKYRPVQADCVVLFLFANVMNFGVSNSSCNFFSFINVDKVLGAIPYYNAMSFLDFPFSTRPRISIFFWKL
jgi:hypothetical protein